jgi:hypothetical protein
MNSYQITPSPRHVALRAFPSRVTGPSDGRMAGPKVPLLRSKGASTAELALLEVAATPLSQARVGRSEVL